MQIASSALIFRDQGSQVATVDAGGHVHLHKITIGRDLGQRVEVASGPDRRAARRRQSAGLARRRGTGPHRRRHQWLAARRGPRLSWCWRARRLLVRAALRSADSRDLRRYSRKAGRGKSPSPPIRSRAVTGGRCLMMRRSTASRPRRDRQPDAGRRLVALRTGAGLSGDRPSGCRTARRDRHQLHAQPPVRSSSAAQRQSADILRRRYDQRSVHLRARLVGSRSQRGRRRQGQRRRRATRTPRRSRSACRRRSRRSICGCAGYDEELKLLDDTVAAYTQADALIRRRFDGGIARGSTPAGRARN